MTPEATRQASLLVAELQHPGEDGDERRAQRAARDQREDGVGDGDGRGERGGVGPGRAEDARPARRRARGPAGG